VVGGHLTVSCGQLSDDANPESHRPAVIKQANQLMTDGPQIEMELLEKRSDTAAPLTRAYLICFIFTS